METLSNTIIFYFVIMDENRINHNHLRKFIRQLVPQAIIESVYDLNEAVHFFKRNAIKPHVLFISEEMSKGGLVISPDGYVNSYLLDEMPLVYLEDKEPPNYFLQLSFLRPYKPLKFFRLLKRLNQKWFK